VAGVDDGLIPDIFGGRHGAARRSGRIV